MTLIDRFVSWTDSKLEALKSVFAQSRSVAGPDAAAEETPGQREPVKVVHREAETRNPKNTLRLWLSFATLAIIFFFAFTPSWQREKKVANDIAAPRTADPEDIGQRVATAQRRIANNQAQALNDVKQKASVPALPPGLPLCGPPVANQVYRQGTDRLGCVFVPNANQWQWTPLDGNGETPQNRGNESGVQPVAQAPQLTAAQQFQQDRMLRYYASLSAPPIVPTHASSTPTVGADASPRPESHPDSTPAPNSAPLATAESDPLNRKQFPYNSALGPFHVVQRGTILEAQLDTAIKGEYSGQVNAHLTHPLYLKGTDVLLIPAGTSVLGSSVSVNRQNQRGLAVSFDQIVFNDGFSLPLSAPMPGGSQDGSSGITDRVNNHVFGTVMTALGVGLIEGLSQVGNSQSGYGYDPSVSLRNGISQTAGQQGMQILQQRLNRVPEIEIRPGSRISIAFAGDVKNVPEYTNHRMVGRL